MWLFKLVNLLRTQMLSRVAGATGRFLLPGETTLQVGKVNMHLFVGGRARFSDFPRNDNRPFQKGDLGV